MTKNKKSKLYMLIERIIKEEVDVKSQVLALNPDAVLVRRKLPEGRPFYIIYSDASQTKFDGSGYKEKSAWQSALNKLTRT